MTNKTTNKFSPEIRERAVRMVLEHEVEHASRWAALSSISAKIGCTPETLRLWVKRVEWGGGGHASRPPGAAGGGGGREGGEGGRGGRGSGPPRDARPAG